MPVRKTCWCVLLPRKILLGQNSQSINSFLFYVFKINGKDSCWMVHNFSVLWPLNQINLCFYIDLMTPKELFTVYVMEQISTSKLIPLLSLCWEWWRRIICFSTLKWIIWHIMTYIPKQQYTSTLMYVSYAGRKARLPK